MRAGPSPRAAAPDGEGSSGSQHQEILIRQEIMLLHELQPRLADIAEKVVARNLVLDGRPHGKLAPVIVDVDDAAVRLERAGETSQVGLAVREVMVGVDDQDEIAGALRNQRIVVEPEDGSDVPQTALRDAFLERLQDARFDV